MRPMGFFPVTSLPSSVRWVLFPCCESSSSQTWWVSVDVLYQGWRVKISKWSGAAQILFTWLTESCAMFSRLLGSSVFHLYYLFKNRDCVCVCTILGHDSGFSLQNFSESIWKDCYFTLRRMTSNWISVFVPWAFWLLLEYEVHMGLIEHSLFLLFELDDFYRLLSVSGLSCWGSCEIGR